MNRSGPKRASRTTPSGPGSATARSGRRTSTAGSSLSVRSYPPRRARRSGPRHSANRLGLWSAILLAPFRAFAEWLLTPLPARPRPRRRRRRPASRAKLAWAWVRSHHSQAAALSGIIIVLLSVYLIRQGVMVPLQTSFESQLPSSAAGDAGLPAAGQPSDTAATPAGDSASGAADGAPGQPSPDAAAGTAPVGAQDSDRSSASSEPPDRAQPVLEREGDDGSSAADVGPATVGEILAGLIPPASGRVIRPFGFYESATFQDWRYHSGTDIALAAGDRVVAAGPGTVTTVEGTRLEGWRVVVSHGCGVTTVYSQLSAAAVSEGQYVDAGATVGLAGEPGILEAELGPHLHYEIRVENSPIDPAPYLDA